MTVGEKFTHLNRTRHILEDGVFLTPRAKYINDLLHVLGLRNAILHQLPTRTPRSRRARN